MCGFDELEDDLFVEKGQTISPELAAREVDNYGFGEPYRREPQLQWSHAPLREMLSDLLNVTLSPLRALARLAWRS